MDPKTSLAASLLLAAEAPSSRVLKLLVAQAAPSLESRIKHWERRRSSPECPVHPNRPRLDPIDARSLLRESTTPELAALLLVTSDDPVVVERVLAEHGTSTTFVRYVWTLALTSLDKLVAQVARQQPYDWHLTPEMIERVLQAPLTSELVDAVLELETPGDNSISEAVLQHPDLTAREIRQIFTAPHSETLEPKVFRLLVQLSDFASSGYPAQSVGRAAATLEAGAAPDMETLADTLRAAEGSLLERGDDEYVNEYLGPVTHWAAAQENVAASLIVKALKPNSRRFLYDWDLDEDTIRLLVAEAAEVEDPESRWWLNDKLLAMRAFPHDLLPRMSLSNLSALTKCLSDDPDEWEIVMALYPQHENRTIEEFLEVIRRL